VREAQRAGLDEQDLAVVGTVDDQPVKVKYVIRKLGAAG
jgi:hypothetical protein